MKKGPPDYSADLVLHPERDKQYVHFQDAAANPFQPRAATIPRVNVWWLADAALTTYWAPVDATRIYARAGLTADYLKKGSTDCYVAHAADFAIVAFRGTEPDEWPDVLTDINLILKPWRVGKVHAGFKKALDDIWPVLLPIVQSHVAAGRAIWFCGHSLGAALATLAAHLFEGTEGVCSFGSPRVGDRVFAAAFDQQLGQKTLRYVNSNDIVTHVPTPALPGLPGYKHVAARRAIARDGTISDADLSLPHFFRELFGSTEALLENVQGMIGGKVRHPMNAFLDHMPKAYAIWTWDDYEANG